MIRPPGRASSPQVNAVPSRPPRAAYSHSASVGSRPPAQAAYACASSWATCTTGWSARLLTELPGPSGWCQQAPGVQDHHWLRCRRSTGPSVPVKTIEPGWRFSGGAPG